LTDWANSSAAAATDCTLVEVLPAASRACSASSFERITRDGRPVWIEGSYNPVPDQYGRIAKIVKFARLGVVAARPGLGIDEDGVVLPPDLVEAVAHQSQEDPVPDQYGRIAKIVKFASDVTAEVKRLTELKVLIRSQNSA
jgi:hypothetical protein